MPSKTVSKGSPKSRGGRPTRAQTERRRILEIGVDPALVDPRRVLAGIAVDPTAPATARVAASRALLAANAGIAGLADLAAQEARADATLEPEMPAEDVLTRRALALMTTGRPQ